MSKRKTKADKVEPTVRMTIRVPVEMKELIERAVADRPIEFRDMSEFIKHAIVEELRSMKFITSYRK